MEQELVTATDAALQEASAEANRPLHTAATIAWARDSILFSSCNEASASELRALGDLTNKHALCITAGGGRVLNLLLANPEVLWAVDLNPAQNFLLELKVAGMRALGHAAYLRFLGVRPCPERLATYAELRAQLTAPARAFFDRRPEMIRNGVLFEGRLERYLRQLSKILQFIQPFGVKRLFSFEDIAQQRKFLRVLDSAFFRLIAETACRRSVLQLFSGDPGFYKYVPREIALHREIYGGVLAHFNQCLARENPLMQLVFFGRVIHEDALPSYLNAATYEQVKGALAKVRLITRTTTIDRALSEIGPKAIDAFSLSDISSYLDDDAHAQLFRDVLLTARSGAKLISRSNIHHRRLPPEQERRMRRDEGLERELAITDHSCVHKFLVAEIL